MIPIGDAQNVHNYSQMYWIQESKLCTLNWIYKNVEWASYSKKLWRQIHFTFL